MTNRRAPPVPSSSSLLAPLVLLLLLSAHGVEGSFFPLTISGPNFASEIGTAVGLYPDVELRLEAGTYSDCNVAFTVTGSGRLRIIGAGSDRTFIDCSSGFPASTAMGLLQGGTELTVSGVSFLPASVLETTVNPRSYFFHLASTAKGDFDDVVFSGFTFDFNYVSLGSMCASVTACNGEYSVIKVEQGDFNMFNCSFERVRSYVGALTVTGDGTVTIASTTFLNNTGYLGAGLTVTGDPLLTVLDSVFERQSLNESVSSWTYVQCANSICLVNNFGGSIDVVNCIFRYNIGRYYAPILVLMGSTPGATFHLVGGSFYANSNGLTLPFPYGEGGAFSTFNGAVTVNDTVFVQSIAYSGFVANVYHSTVVVNRIIVEDSTYTSVLGGAFSVGDGTSLTLNDCVFQDLNLPFSKGIVVDARGFFSVSTVVLRNISVVDFIANNQGVLVSVDGDFQVSISNCYVSRGESLGNAGSIVFLSAGTMQVNPLELVDCVFENIELSTGVVTVFLRGSAVVERLTLSDYVGESGVLLYEYNNNYGNSASKVVFEDVSVWNARSPYGLIPAFREGNSMILSELNVTNVVFDRSLCTIVNLNGDQATRLLMNNVVLAQVPPSNLGGHLFYLENVVQSVLTNIYVESQAAMFMYLSQSVVDLSSFNFTTCPDPPEFVDAGVDVSSEGPSELFMSNGSITCYGFYTAAIRVLEGPAHSVTLDNVALGGTNGNRVWYLDVIDDGNTMVGLPSNCVATTVSSISGYICQLSTPCVYDCFVPDTSSSSSSSSSASESSSSSSSWSTTVTAMNTTTSSSSSSTLNMSSTEAPSLTTTESSSSSSNSFTSSSSASSSLNAPSSTSSTVSFCDPTTEYTRDGECLPCPRGGFCDGGPWVWPIRGYWSETAFKTPYQCGIYEACPGAIGEVDGVDGFVIDPVTGPVTAVCSSLYKGEFCAECGYETYKDNQRCVPCLNPNGSTNSNTNGLVVATALVIVLVSLCVIFLPERTVDTIVSGIMLAQVFILVGRDSARHVTGPLGAGLASAFRYLSIVNLDVEVMALDCAVGSSFGFSRVYWGSLGVWAVAVVLLQVASLIQIFVSWLRGVLPSNLRAHILNRSIYIGVVTVMLAYLQVTLRAIQGIHCVVVNDESRLAVELSTLCSSEAHGKVAGVSIALVVMLVAPLPLAVGLGVVGWRTHPSATTPASEPLSKSDEEGGKASKKAQPKTAKATDVFHQRFGFLVRNLRHSTLANAYPGVKLLCTFLLVLQLVLPVNLSYKLMFNGALVFVNVLYVTLVWPFKKWKANLAVISSGVVTSLQSAIILVAVIDPARSTTSYIGAAFAIVGGIVIFVAAVLYWRYKEGEFERESSDSSSTLEGSESSAELERSKSTSSVALSSSSSRGSRSSYETDSEEEYES